MGSGGISGRGCTNRSVWGSRSIPPHGTADCRFLTGIHAFGMPVFPSLPGVRPPPDNGTKFWPS